MPFNRSIFLDDLKCTCGNPFFLPLISTSWVYNVDMNRYTISFISLIGTNKLCHGQSDRGQFIVFICSTTTHNKINNRFNKQTNKLWYNISFHIVFTLTSRAVSFLTSSLYVMFQHIPLTLLFHSLLSPSLVYVSAFPGLPRLNIASVLRQRNYVHVG